MALKRSVMMHRIYSSDLSSLSSPHASYNRPSDLTERLDSTGSPWIKRPRFTACNSLIHSQSHPGSQMRTLTEARACTSNHRQAFRMLFSYVLTTRGMRKKTPLSRISKYIQHRMLLTTSKAARTKGLAVM